MNKYVCIKAGNGWSLPHYSVKVGEIYLCKESIYSPEYYETSEMIAYFYYIGLFDKSNFITLADWREKQINSILE